MDVDLPCPPVNEAAPPPPPERTRVLIIDDSAYNRRVLRRMLESERGIEVVESARDGEEGLRRALELSPDVITLDLEMPKMDGFTFLRILMARKPTPVIVVSGKSDRQTTFLAMELGAVDFVAKPQNQISPDLYDIEADLVRKIAAARLASVHRLGAASRPAETPAKRPATVGPAPLPSTAGEAATPGRREARCVVLGSSTGGPTALHTLLSSLPSTFPAPAIIAQHMPPGFTRAFAERINKTCGLEVSEAQHDESVRKGHVLVAPGGYHVRIEGTRDAARVMLERTGGADRYVPSVDTLFKSAASVFGPELLAVVLTGMGDDGKEGVREVKAKGGQTLAESEETAVIFGMPKEAIRTGSVDAQAPIDRMAQEMAARCAWDWRAREGEDGEARKTG